MVYDEGGWRPGCGRVIGELPGVAEKRMFGGLAFLLNGNTACLPPGRR